MITIDSFIDKLETIFEEVDPGILNSDTRFQELSQWDSLVALSLIALLDSEYNFQTSIKNIQECKTIKELHSLVANK